MATITFVNNSDASVLLYNQLLPGDTMKLNTISVLAEENSGNVDFLGTPDTTIHYYAGSYKILPVVIPIVKPQNFVKLDKKSRIIFKVVHKLRLEHL